MNSAVKLLWATGSAVMLFATLFAQTKSTNHLTRLGCLAHRDCATGRCSFDFFDQERRLTPWAGRVIQTILTIQILSCLWMLRDFARHLHSVRTYKS